MQDRAVDAERLWLDTLQLVTARAAHELKGALNGVSVNLEVVRGRAADARQPASAVARFADAAATQLDVVIDMNEALLALARRPRAPADVGAALRQVTALLVPVAEAAGIPLAVQVDADGLSSSAAAGVEVVRSVLARAVLALVDAGGGAVQLSGSDGATVVRVAAAAGTIELDPRTSAAAAGAGVGMTTEGPVLTLTFPGTAPLLAQTQPTTQPTTHGTA